MARIGWVAVAMAAVMLTGCEPEEPDWTMPDPAEVSQRYGAGVEATLSGNVLEIHIDFRDALRRGGALWARSGPYFYLFSSPTRSLFESYPDLAAVRAITRTTGREEVARATLRRDALTEVGWRRAVGVAARAQTEGTEHPGRLRDLVHLGEDHTEYEYSEEFVTPVGEARPGR